MGVRDDGGIAAGLVELTMDAVGPFCSDVCAARFSNSVSRFHRLPSDAGRPYVEALLRIVQQESIDLFVPCSGVGTGIEEAEAACMMRKGECGGKAVQTVIQDAELLETLHEKVSRGSPLQLLGMRAASTPDLSLPVAA